MVWVRDSLLALASFVTLMIAASHFLLVQDSNWANGPSRTARARIFWFVFGCYICILFVVVKWNRNVRRLLRFEIPEPIILYYGFVFNILLSVAFPEQTLLDIVICSLLAYSLFSLIEIVQPTINLGTLGLVLSVLSYKVCVTDTLWIWRVLFGLQCIMLPLWFWMVTRTKRDDGTEDTTGRETDDHDGGGVQVIDLDEPERRPAPVAREIQTTGSSTVDDDGGDHITVVDEEVPLGIPTAARRNVVDEAGRPAQMATNEGIVLPLHEAETGAQMPEIGRQELRAIIFYERRDAVINVRIGVLRDVVEEMRDAIVGSTERNVAADEVERDAADEEVSDEEVRDVVAQGVTDEVERDVATQVAEVARDATIAEAVTRYVMTDLSIQIPDDEGIVPPLQEDQIVECKPLVDQGIDSRGGSDDKGTEGMVPPPQEDQTIEDKHLVDQGIDNAGGSDCKGTKGIVLSPKEDQNVESEPSVDHQEKDIEGGSGESGQRGRENPDGSK
ncbi:hypothetical protein SLEP1_g54582 [Rubroshorea leprosula]|uniref:Uncharacterized protein n=1 Tax=Rubroshorea leprosula TaxID=152421 RepID=A0AAV5ME06_9ROSI|nr:hypothetical protein SLEP1_g54582 [Rubroshorea leprosula]